MLLCVNNKGSYSCRCRGPQATQRTELSTDVSPKGKDEAGGAQLESHTGEEPSPDATSPGKESTTGVDGDVLGEAVVEEADARPAPEGEEVVDGKTELTPTAPAWTPGGVSEAEDATEKTSAPASSPCSAPPDDDSKKAGCASGATESAGDGEKKETGVATPGLSS